MNLQVFLDFLIAFNKINYLYFIKNIYFQEFYLKYLSHAVLKRLSPVNIFNSMSQYFLYLSVSL